MSGSFRATAVKCAVFAALAVPLPAPGTAAEGGVADSVERLRGHVRRLSVEIGERNFRHSSALAAAAEYIAGELTRAGYKPSREEYLIGEERFANILAEKPGRSRPREIFVIGAHYDSAEGSPGADDNASGVAVLLELAREFAAFENERTLRLAAFVNEEPPFFRTGLMGSRVHAHGCKKRKEDIVAALSLEMLGYFTDEPASQSYPPFLSFFYPDKGNFIAIVGNLKSRRLVRELEGRFSASSSLPVESIATVSLVPGVDFSDHGSFWKYGYPAAMVTDTAFYRYAFYHTPLDREEALDYGRMAQVAEGLSGWLEHALR